MFPESRVLTGGQSARISVTANIYDKEQSIIQEVMNIIIRFDAYLRYV